MKEHDTGLLNPKDPNVNKTQFELVLSPEWLLLKVSTSEEIIIPKYQRSFQEVKDDLFDTFSANASRAKN